MNALRLPLAVALALGVTISGFALAAKPSVVILATGGTIAGAQAEGQDAGYKSGSFQVQDLTKAVPKLGELADIRSEEHTSELQSRLHLVCRLLLEKKK